MLDYDEEAAHYDETRGGEARAQAAARALSALLPGAVRVVLDVAGGTGIVAEALTSTERCVLVCDASQGMLRRAALRLPGRAVRADSTKLPFAEDSVDAVTTVGLLQLLDVVMVEATMREVARVLRSGGRYLTTVDKSAAHASPTPHAVTDSRAEVTAFADGLGLQCVGDQAFVGHGQGAGAGGNEEPVYTLLAFERVR